MGTGGSDPGGELEFVWDPGKAVSNVAKHGVTFAQAAAVFSDPLALTVYDEVNSDFEDRWFTLGMDSTGKLLAVAHTFAEAGQAGATVRLISAREATRAERLQYENA